MTSPVVSRGRLPIRGFVANHQHVRLHVVHQVILVLQIRFEVIPPLELGGQVDAKNLVGKVDYLLLLLETGLCHRGGGREELDNQVGSVGQDEVRADVHQLLSCVLLCHRGDLQDVLLAQLLPKERGQSHLQVVHQIEVSHGEKTFGISSADVLRYADSVDEVAGCSKNLGKARCYNLLQSASSKHLGRALLHLNHLFLVAHSSAQCCLEVFGPGGKYHIYTYASFLFLPKKALSQH